MSVSILHFSDVLCVWAYVSQIRVDELVREFGEDVVLDYHFCPVFGDTRAKMDAGWSDRGGLQGYSRHVQEIVDRFEHVGVHPEIWRRNVPSSSLSVHLFLRAAALALAENQGGDSGGRFGELIWRVREAFFQQLVDVGQRQAQLELAEQAGLEVALVEGKLNSGEAAAALSRDLDLVAQYGVTVSPTLIFNEGRQRLNGNVGYRIIEANIRELLRTPEAEQSWC